MNDKERKEIVKETLKVTESLSLVFCVEPEGIVTDGLKEFMNSVGASFRKYKCFDCEEKHKGFVVRPTYRFVNRYWIAMSKQSEDLPGLYQELNCRIQDISDGFSFDAYLRLFGTLAFVRVMPEPATTHANN